MSQKRKYEMLDKELRPKYEHLSEYEYQQVRARYINSRWRKIQQKVIFRGLVIPWGVGILLLVLLTAFTGGDVPSFVTLLLGTAITIWTCVELCRCHMERDKLPELYAGLLTYKRISRDIGGSGLSMSLIIILFGFFIMLITEDDNFDRIWLIVAPVLLFLGIGSAFLGQWRWKTGKYRLVTRKAVRKDYSEGDGETGDTFWLFFDNPDGKEMKHCVSENVYGDMKYGDRYYLVLKKNLIGRDKILLYYKAELTTLDDKLKAMLQK